MKVQMSEMGFANRISCRLGFLGFAAALSIGTAQANSCTDLMYSIQQDLYGRPWGGASLLDMGQSVVNEVRALERSSDDLIRTLSNNPRPPQFAQSVNGNVSTASTQNLHSREALFNAASLINNDFEQEYQRARAMVCQGGNCSPGITAALDHMRDIARNALGNVNNAKAQAEGVDATLGSVRQAVDSAQNQVNSAVGNSGALNQAQILNQMVDRISKTTYGLVEDSTGSRRPSIRSIAYGLDQFSNRGCVNSSMP